MSLFAANRRHRLAPICRCYLFEVAHQDGTYFTESGFLPRGQDQGLQDAVAGAQQADDLVAVWEVNPAQGVLRNVSVDVAALLLEGFDGDKGDLPAFVTDNLTISEVEDHFSALAAQRRLERELASPEAVGRV